MLYIGNFYIDEIETSNKEQANFQVLENDTSYDGHSFGRIYLSTPWEWYVFCET